MNFLSMRSTQLLMNLLRISFEFADCSLLSMFVFYFQFIKPQHKAAAVAETEAARISKDDSNVYAMSLLKNITHTHCVVHTYAQRTYV